MERKETMKMIRKTASLLLAVIMLMCAAVSASAEEAGLLTYDEKNSIYLGLREKSYPSALTKQKLFLYEMM